MKHLRLNSKATSLQAVILWTLSGISYHNIWYYNQLSCATLNNYTIWYCTNYESGETVVKSNIHLISASVSSSSSPVHSHMEHCIHEAPPIFHHTSNLQIFHHLTIRIRISVNRWLHKWVNYSYTNSAIAQLTMVFHNWNRCSSGFVPPRNNSTGTKSLAGMFLGNKFINFLVHPSRIGSSMRIGSIMHKNPVS